MTAHTPGPWHWRKYAQEGENLVLLRKHGLQPTLQLDNDGATPVLAGEGGPVARVVCKTPFKRGSGHLVECAERDANARLIAAAPRMYQWLTAHYAIEEGPGQTDRPEYEELRQILKAVQP